MIRRVFFSARVALVIALLAHLSACNGCSQPLENDFFEPTGFGEYEFDGEPDIEAPERVLFGEVGVGQTSTQTFEVRNVGRATLDFDKWTVTDGFDLNFTNSLEPPQDLRGGESVVVAVSFTAPDDEEHRGVLTIESNDPDEPIVEIDLFVNARFPCLETIPDDSVDFGEIDPGETLPRIVTIRNCSPNAETTFTVEGISGSSAFAFAEPLGFETRTLAIGEEVEVVIGFTPPEPGLFEGTLDIVSNDEFRPEHQLELRGRGAEGECPTAVISGVSTMSGAQFVASPTGQFETIPLDRLVLRSESEAYDGKFVDRWSWSVIRRPQDSAAAFANPAGSMGQELFLDLAGDYVLELEVWDSDGVQSCAPARLTVHAIADEDIHVQLVWDTPNDPNQNDSSGSDVDLHLLHPNGQWNRAPWDCFWQNLIPDWASSRPAGVDSFDCERDPDREGCHDDPSLDIDDVDGWGPENINLNNPELNRTYAVGIHYFSDHGYGISMATVRIYIGGVLRAEFPRQRLYDQEFWHVADIDWPSGEIQARGQVYDSFP